MHKRLTSHIPTYKSRASIVKRILQSNAESVKRFQRAVMELKTSG